MSNRIEPEVIRIPINAAQQRRLDTLGHQMDTIMQRRSEAVSAIIEGTMTLDGLEKHHLAIEPGFIVLTPPPDISGNGKLKSQAEAMTG